MNFMKSLLIFCVLVLIVIAGWAVGSELKRSIDDRKFIEVCQIVDNENSFIRQTRNLYVRKNKVSAIWKDGTRTYILVNGKSFRVDASYKNMIKLFGKNK